jgi:hypothetical protein
LVLGDNEEWNDVSGQWFNEWPLDSWVDSPIVQRLTVTFLSMLENPAAEYPEPDEDEASKQVLLHKPDIDSSALPCAPPPQNAVQFCSLPGQLCHLKWWLTKYCAHDLDIFYLYAEMGNNESTEMQLKF